VEEIVKENYMAKTIDSPSNSTLRHRLTYVRPEIHDLSCSELTQGGGQYPLESQGGGLLS
jgi:hypothetical protein